MNPRNPPPKKATPLSRGQRLSNVSLIKVKDSGNVPLIKGKMFAKQTKGINSNGITI
jgi:hypothetical protein